jgi:hypothetical protein
VASSALDLANATSSVSNRYPGPLVSRFIPHTAKFDILVNLSREKCSLLRDSVGKLGLAMDYGLITALHTVGVPLRLEVNQMGPEYKLDNATGMAPGESASCMQCKKLLNTAKGFSLEVRDDNGIVGYLHPQGPCRADWEKAHPGFSGSIG